MASSEPRFVRLYPGPTLQWGGEIKTGTEHCGVTYPSRYCTTNLYGLTDDGRVFALAYDHGAPPVLAGGPPVPAWMRIGGEDG